MPDYVTKNWHRDAMPIPTDPAERKALLWWLMEHPLWKSPAPQILLDADFGDELSTEEKMDLYMEDHYGECVSTLPTYVNPVTDRIDDDDSLNLAFRVWIEAGPIVDLIEYESPEPEGGWTDENKWGASHDHRLDCGASDMETALLALAVRVKFYYGEGKDDNEKQSCGERHWTSCNVYDEEDDEVFCPACGFRIKGR